MSTLFAFLHHLVAFTLVSAVKLADNGNSECIKPLSEQKDGKDEDDDDKLGEQLRKQSEDMLRMLKKK